MRNPTTSWSATRGRLKSWNMDIEDDWLVGIAPWSPGGDEAAVNENFLWTLVVCMAFSWSTFCFLNFGNIFRLSSSCFVSIGGSIGMVGAHVWRRRISSCSYAVCDHELLGRTRSKTLPVNPTWCEYRRCFLLIPRSGWVLLRVRRTIFIWLRAVQKRSKFALCLVQ